MCRTCLGSNGRIILAYFKVPSQHLLLQAEINRKTPQSVHPISEQGIDPGTFMTRNRSVNNSTSEFDEIEEGCSRGEAG
jgi:hypothetical protein